VSKHQCLVGDWQTVGYQDGLNGVQSTALLRHQNTCLKYDVTPDRDAYLLGWRDGVLRYCQPDHAFDVGSRGARYGNVCPDHLDSAFRTAFNEGRRLYLAQAEIDNLHSAIDQREIRLREVKAQLAGVTGAVLQPEATIPELASMVISAKDLAEEKGRLEAEIAELRRELAAKAATLPAA
jgi:ribosome modulation factor